MNQLNVLTAVVVDDEKPARDHLASMLAGIRDVEVVACLANGEEALHLLGSRAIDLLFLDIQMPGMGGLEVARRLAYDGAPRTVFVTAYEDFAVEAFELHALDYLLKPFPKSRLEHTLSRARQELNSGRAPEYIRRMRDLLQAGIPGEAGAFIERFHVQTGGRQYLLPVQKISLIEASDHYTKLWSDGLSHLILRAISSLEGELDPAKFLRIHRTKIVNLDFVCAVRSGQSGPMVEMKDGSRHAVSRRRQDTVPHILEYLSR